VRPHAKHTYSWSGPSPKSLFPCNPPFSSFSSISPIANKEVADGNLSACTHDTAELISKAGVPTALYQWRALLLQQHLWNDVVERRFHKYFLCIFLIGRFSGSA
jgi:hypothetical protein